MPSTAVQHAARHGLITSLCLFTSIGSAWAGVLTFSGNLSDPANAALVASDLSAPSFADDYAIANNVALYTLHVPVAGSVSFTSTTPWSASSGSALANASSAYVAPSDRYTNCTIGRYPSAY